MRTEKKTPQHKSTYTINTTLQQGETYPALASSHPVKRHLLRRWSQTRLTKPGGTKPEALGRGRGIMSVIGEGARESHCSALPRVVIQHGLGRGWLVRAGEPEKIRLICCVFGCILSQLFSLSILSILVSESINFHLQSRELHRDRIHIPVNSLSLNADRSSHSFNQKTGSLVRLWTAVPVF